jgi:proteasome-associated ATPase
MIQRVVERIYTEAEDNRFIEVTYANGDKEVLYFKDFNSGAMIENIVAGPRRWPSRTSSRPARRGCGCSTS